MGYYIAKGNKSTQENIFRGAKLIGLGLMLNVALNAHLLIKIYYDIIVINPGPYLFGADILILAGLSIILLGLFMKVFGKNLLAYFITILLIFAIQDFVKPPEGEDSLSYIMAFIFSNNWWSYFPLVPWLEYPVSGILFFYFQKHERFHISMLQHKLILIVSGIILILSLKYGIEIASQLQVYYHHSYQYFLFTINFIIFWSELMYLFKPVSNSLFLRLIRWIGINVTVIYVIQWIIIGNIATAVYKTQNGIQLILWIFFIISLSILLTYLYNYLTKKRANLTQNKEIKPY